MTNPTVEQMRWNQIRKQGLLDTIHRDFYDVVKSSIALHSTDYWTPYLSAWARIGDFDAEQVFMNMNSSGDLLVRRPAFRNTHHLIHTENLPLILRALGPHLERSMRPAPPLKHLSDKELDRCIEEIIGILKEGPASMNDLKERLPHIGDQMRWILLIANGRGLTIRTRGSHARSSRLDYDLVSRWVGKIDLTDTSEEDARKELALKYIDLFGPVSIDDLSWCLPAKKTESKKILSDLSMDITDVSLNGDPHYMTKTDIELATSLELPSNPVVFFLPYEDHFPKAFKNRSWYMSEELQPIIFPRNREHYWPPKLNPPPPGPPKGMNASGEKRPSIWVDGKIVGRWEIDQEGSNAIVSIGIASKISPKVKPIIEEKRNELQTFIEERLLPISG